MNAIIVVPKWMETFNNYYLVVESRSDRYVGQCKYLVPDASINVKRNLWEIRKISGRHTCVSTCISQDHTKLSSSFIASCIIQLVSEDPDIPIKAIVKEVVTRFDYTVTYRKAWTAKQILLLPLSKERLKKLGVVFLQYSDICYSLTKYMGTSLLGALRTELPQWCNAQSVYCIRHVASNFNKEFKDTDLK
ncbi:hypothetical protein Lal_00022504 [Lupinus albus]|nr:hypothetical protein Lal_00022504 [Lupinus albus]